MPPVRQISLDEAIGVGGHGKKNKKEAKVWKAWESRMLMQQLETIQLQRDIPFPWKELSNRLAHYGIFSDNEQCRSCVME